MSDATIQNKRQWISMPGGSCDVRIGKGVIEASSAVLKGSVGRPRAAALVTSSAVGEDLAEELRRQLTDAGYEVSALTVEEGTQARTLEAAGALFDALAEAGITADDLVVFAGDSDSLALGSYVCGQWCAGVALVMVPTSLTALLEAPATPRGIDVGGKPQMLSLRPSVKHVLADTGVLLAETDAEDVLMARVLMLITAMCDSEAAFSRLWDRSEKISAGDHDTLCEQLLDTMKLRGKILSSTSLALRQSITYGQAFARALERVAGVAPSTARAEALRFQARLSAGEGNFEVDDVLAQDELLAALELPVAQVAVDAAELTEAIREERFLRTNRFLLGLPRKLGRVRLASVSDELIAEHIGAWCASRAQ